MSDETALAYRQAQQAYGGDPADPAELLAAARAHLEASRPLEEIKAEYEEAQAARERGEETDPVAHQVLAEELAPVREAAANLAGSLPGTAHAAAAGIGGAGDGLG